MKKAVKAIWIIAIAIAVVALAWFLYLIIYNRNRLGPAGPYTLYFIWFPTLFFVVVSIILLIRGKIAVKRNSQIMMIVFLILFSSFFSVTLIREPHYERLMQKISEQNRQFFKEITHVTDDGKYDYRFYLTGRLTNSPRSHVIIRDLSTDLTNRINIKLNYEGIGAVENLPNTTRLIHISSTDADHIYTLTTTPHLKDEIEIFELNMETNTSKKIE